MKRFYFKSLLLWLIQLYFPVSAQNQHVVDSLQNFISSRKNDTTTVSALLSLSFQYEGINPDKAFEYGLKSLNLAQQLNYEKGIGNAHNNLGDLYWYRSDYSSSHDHYFKALKIFEKLNDEAAIADCNRNIGWVYYDQNNLSIALEYYEKSLVTNQKLKRKKKMGQNYNDIGIVYDDLKKYDEAIINYQKALKLQQENGTKESTIAIYGNLGLAYYKIKKMNFAIQNIEKSVALSEEVGNKRSLSESYSNLGSLYIEAGRYDDAIPALQKSISFGKAINYKKIIKDCYGNFATLYLKKNDFKKAFEYEQLFTAIKDSIANDNNSREATEMIAKYESEKKELMISSLEKDKKLIDEKLVREKNFKIYLIIFCIMIAAFAFVFFRGNVQKKKANVALSLAYKEIEMKNKDITDSINYSKRIQESSLPTMELKHKLFPNAFILFKPKDIVSGDFYWFTEINDKKLIAACDCTGHGVPGALMSMIGNNILNQIVNEKGITSPDKILNQLHLDIRKSLKQNEQVENSDGMDIAMIAFNLETGIEFAGAQRPLWLIRNNTIEEIKPDKFSIGGMQPENNRSFTNNFKSLSKGDCIYIFTDGYVDQFGGTEGKKFMSKRFKELLLSVHTKPMSEQEKILNHTIENWKGVSEQIDDILVIGIRI